MSAEEKKIKPETEAIIDNTRGTQPAKPKLVDPATLIETPAEAAPTPVPSPSDIFNDLEALREQSKMTVRRRSVLVNVFVVKHPANNKYFRCHPEKRMSLDATVIWDDRACYYVIAGPVVPDHSRIERHALFRMAAEVFVVGRVLNDKDIHQHRAPADRHL